METNYNPFPAFNQVAHSNETGYPTNIPISQVPESLIEMYEKEYSEPLQPQSSYHFPGGLVYAD